MQKRQSASETTSAMMSLIAPLCCESRQGIEPEKNLEALTRAPLAELSAEVVRFWEVHEDAPAGTAVARQAHWANIRELYVKVRKELHGSVNLSRVDQDTEARLYACVSLEYFSPHPLAEPGVVVSPPLYSPQQAGLRVFFERGGWHATWTRLEEPLFQPVETRWQWITIEEGEPGFLRFRDCTNPLLQGRGGKG